MSDVKRATRLANLEQTCDPELIYSRALALQATSRKIDTQTLLSHELSSYPLSLFDDSGEMRLCSSKAVLKTKTHVEMLGRNISSLECQVLDGCAILWVIQWPSNTGKEKAQVKDFIDSFVSFILYKMQEADIYLVFDRYLDYSTKTSTRQARGTGGCKTFQLLYASPLPTQTQVLNNSKNKKQLIALIVEKLIERLTEQDDEFQHKLVVTGQNPCPVELFKGLCIQRQDLINHHEEADAIVVSQAIYVSTVEGKSVGVVADDTDIYIMLLYHYKKHQPTSLVMMIPTKQGRSVTDIGLTAGQLGDLCLQLLPAHALTGCDQVPMLYGIAKGKMLSAVKENSHSLDLLGQLAANFDEVMQQATSFITSCYSVKGAKTMTEARIKLWNKRAMKNTARKAPPLCSLPPTTAAFKQNVKRAHLQAAIWIKATEDPPNVDPTEYGWDRNDELKVLLPSTLPSSEKVAPEEVMKVLCCTCSSARPCFSKACSCYAAPLGCTEHCKCEGGLSCNNPYTIKPVESEEDSDDD